MLLDNQKRPPPPKSLSAEAAEVWRETVASLRADYFVQSDFPLLENYASAVAAARRARAVVEQQGPVVDGKLSPAMSALDAETRRISLFAVKLRLTPQARWDRYSASVKIRPPSRPQWEIDADPAKDQLGRYGLS